MGLFGFCCCGVGLGFWGVGIWVLDVCLFGVVWGWGFLGVGIWVLDMFVCRCCFKLCIAHFGVGSWNDVYSVLVGEHPFSSV